MRSAVASMCRAARSTRMMPPPSSIRPLDRADFVHAFPDFADGAFVVGLRLGHGLIVVGRFHILALDDAAAVIVQLVQAIMLHLPLPVRTRAYRLYAWKKMI